MKTSFDLGENATNGSSAFQENKVNGSAHLPSRAHILLVDDRADKLLALEAILAPLEQNLVVARSGKEALRHLLRRDFAVILLDVAMPTMDGFETAALIRRRQRSEHTPIIFVTSISHSDDSIFHGYTVGAVDYVVAPIQPEVLRSKVSVFVELYRKTELIKYQAEQLRQIEEAKHQRELAEAVDRLQAETQRNRFFTLAQDLLGISNVHGSLLEVNPSWEKVLGFSEAELKVKSYLDLIHPAERELMRVQFEKLKRDNVPIYFEGRYQCKDGSYCWLAWTAVPFSSEELVYIFARDITARKAVAEEIKSLNSELNRRVNDLTDVNKELESFNYSISHDLRAPLRSIASFTQIVLTQYDQVLPEQGQDYLRRVESAAKYMDKLLMDLLDYSRLSRSQIVLSGVSLESAVSDVLFSIDQEIRARNASVEIARPLGQVIGHPATVRQILFNLIANALKFTAANKPPRIRIWTERADGLLRIWVEDNGIGIPAQFHRKIFGLFQRLHSQNAYPGTGVGLAMVQKGVERMAGRIGVDSEIGKGSRFWFVLRASDDASDEQLDFATGLQKPQP
ncbi:MAG: sensor histidine kinase [Verrucomicrobiota bacterium]